MKWRIRRIRFDLKNKKNVDIDKTVIKKEEETDDKEQQIQLLYKCISELSEADRLIITLLLEEVPYNEIAAVTEISESNLRVKIHRIKQQLSTIYAKYEKIWQPTGNLETTEAKHPSGRFRNYSESKKRETDFRQQDAFPNPYTYNFYGRRSFGCGNRRFQNGNHLYRSWLNVSLRIWICRHPIVSDDDA